MALFNLLCCVRRVCGFSHDRRPARILRNPTLPLIETQPEKLHIAREESPYTEFPNTKRLQTATQTGPWSLETSYVLVSIPTNRDNMEWGWYKVLGALIRLDMDAEDKLPSRPLSSHPWGHAVWPCFRWEHTVKMCWFLQLTKWLPSCIGKNSPGAVVRPTQERTEQGTASSLGSPKRERTTHHEVG